MTTQPSELNLGKSAADKIADAADTALGTPILTPAERDAKPSTELKIVGTMADANQNRDVPPSNTKELDLSGPYPYKETQDKPKLANKKEETVEPADPIVFQTSIGEKIPDALTNMMLMSKAVHDDLTVIDKSDPTRPKTYTPRISSVLSTDPTTKQPIVTYHIERFAIPADPGNNTSASSDTGDTAASPDSTPGAGSTSNQPQTNNQANDATKLPEILEFDYIYTGKNVDVIQFDMNVKLSLNSLKPIQVVHPTASNTNKDITPDNQTTTNKKPNDNAGEARDVKVSRVRPDSTLNDSENDTVGHMTVDPKRTGSGSLSPETLFAARQNMANQISMMASQTVSTLKIVGNPLLLAGYVLPADTYDDPDPNVVKQKKDEHAQNTGANQSGLLQVRVNVRTPKPSYLQGAKLGDNDNFYSTPSWMNDLKFNIKKITSKFTKGEFVQFIDLQSAATQTNTEGGNIGAKHPPTSVSKPADQAINETKGNNIKAFLDMISHAEGTYGHGDNGYNIRFGTVIFEGYATHPWHVKPWSTGKIPHTPAGRYQIIVGTYDRNKASCGGDFSPSSQDRIAIAIMKSVGNSYSDVVKGDPKTAIRKLKPTTWTGLQKPTEAQLLKWYEQHGGTYEPQTSDALPSAGSGQGATGTSNNASNSGGLKDVNDKLVSNTKDANAKGVKWAEGARNPESGSVDCSGWVLDNTKKAVAGNSDPNIQNGYALMKQGNTAAGMIQNVGKASGQELTGSDINTNNLKPGMLIGIDYGTGNGRYKDISHIAQVAQDPNTGKLLISQSGSKGVEIRDADEWIKNRKKYPLYAVDPFYKSR